MASWTVAPFQAYRWGYKAGHGLQIQLPGYSLRHTYASWLVMGGVDLYRVKELMGHSSIQTTMRYAHLAPDNLRNEVERVFG